MASQQNQNFLSNPTTAISTIIIFSMLNMPIMAVFLKSQCSSGIWEDGKDFCFYFYGTDKAIRTDSIQNAENYCASNQQVLIKIYNSKMKNLLSDAIVNWDSSIHPLQGYYFTMGLQETNGAWGWTDGTPLTYTSWAKNEPMSYFSCAYVVYNLVEINWFSGSCVDPHNFICMDPIFYTRKTSVATTRATTIKAELTTTTRSNIEAETAATNVISNSNTDGTTLFIPTVTPMTNRVTNDPEYNAKTVGIIAGSVIGFLVLAAIIGVIVYFVIKRRKRSQLSNTTLNLSIHPVVGPSGDGQYSKLEHPMDDFLSGIMGLSDNQEARYNDDIFGVGIGFGSVGFVNNGTGNIDFGMGGLGNFDGSNQRSENDYVVGRSIGNNKISNNNNKMNNNDNKTNNNNNLQIPANLQPDEVQNNNNNNNNNNDDDDAYVNDEVINKSSLKQNNNNNNNNDNNKFDQQYDRDIFGNNINNNLNNNNNNNTYGCDKDNDDYYY
ncbi:hypothetical protein HELRODRAFT_182585 [Helobdella robusta]|uniref:C-type lectin domain-containing protein n=1 Tax=Helobdella robusta TaxID=6412 RepID=T1FIE8_HELRO|nr:hypothetical protein HELRODRAFT_182585 [Helobdella robusta]ESN90876.1 hypothetical protein HELRODRAFT_182585 [Helobdella robusta]